MMTNSAERGAIAAAEALTWVGTRFHEQQALKGHGCDCKGLIAGVAAACGFPEGRSFHAVSVAYDLRRPGGIPVKVLRDGLDANFDRLPRDAALQPGDVLLHRAGGYPSHLSIVTGAGLAVHAWPKARRVKETSLDTLFAECPLVAVYRWRDHTQEDARQDAD